MRNALRRGRSFAFHSPGCRADSRRMQPDATAAGRFPETRWTIVQRARGTAPAPEVASALQDICRGYWLPVYAFIRRSGERAAEAEELTQEFMLRLAEGEYLGHVERERGKLRTFLLACVKHFLADHRRAGQRLKRGGGHEHVSIDQALAESAYGIEPVDALTPDVLFERRWARSLVEKVVAEIAGRLDEQGRAILPVALPFARQGAAQEPREEVAARLGMSADALKMAVSRLRQKFRDQLRLEVAGTLGPDDDLEAEMQHLRSVLAEVI